MCSVTWPGSSVAISSVPVAEPRMSTPAAAPCSQRIAVHPVRAPKSETCPTRIPGISVSPFIGLICVYGSIEVRGPLRILLDPLKEFVASVQDFFLLTGQAVRNIFRSPHYSDDIFMQMDVIGVGSLMIAGMTGFFGGAVMALQMSKALATYGQVSKTGTLVSLTLVRELGPVLTGIMVAGRNASGIASELGSMKVTEQIDAMRALGTDPVQKLVTPRLVATCLLLPMLTVIADFVGLVGCFLIAKLLLGQTTSEFWSTAWRA